MWRKSLTFNHVLALLTLVFTIAVVGDLALRGLARHPVRPVWSVPGGDVERGRQAIQAHGCGSCHVIPGIRIAVGRVGPKLEEFSEQIYIAGVLTNQPDNLISWIQDPLAINPKTAMPNLGVTEAEARDIAAYLYTLD